MSAVVLQRLLNNAREASKVTGSSASSSSSSASNSGSEDEQESAHSTQAATHKDKQARPEPAAEHDVAHSAAEGSARLQTESSCPTTSETLQVPSRCNTACSRQVSEQLQSGQALNGTDNTLLPASPVAASATSAATSAAASTSGSSSAQAASEERPSRKRRWRPSWYSATEAGNSSTGQGSAPQPWWRLDSWVTAPAELQFQRSVKSEHQRLYLIAQASMVMPYGIHFPLRSP